jgi:peptidoglycan/xylan/chitin deacetylase (PgdA/CDA1 family)
MSRWSNRFFPILLYHNVGYAKSGAYPDQTISPERFERHLLWLSRHGFKAVGLPHWMDCVAGRRPVPSGILLITFDDGYAALADYAFPLLNKYSFGACVFLVTGRMGSTNSWDEACGYESHRLLGVEQVRHWSTHGIDFGSHGHTHADLTALPPSACEDELVRSRDELESILGRRPAAFAYPYGFYNPAVVAAVRGAYTAAFTAGRGLNTVRTDPHLLRRALVDPHDSLLDLSLRVRLGFNPLALVRRLVRRRAPEIRPGGSAPSKASGRGEPQNNEGAGGRELHMCRGRDCSFSPEHLIR